MWGKNSKARQNTGQILRKKHFCASRNVIPCRFNDVQVPKWRIFAFCLWWWWFFFLRFHLSGHSITRWTWRGGGRSVTVGHMIKSTIQKVHVCSLEVFGGGGQYWVKYGPRSCWTTPYLMQRNRLQFIKKRSTGSKSEFYGQESK